MSTPAPDLPPPLPRDDARYSHISVGLRYCDSDGQWHPLRALGWNAQGFNFYSAQPIPMGPLQLKRGLTPFAGAVVWRARNTDPDAMRAMLVNQLLFHKAREMQQQPLYARLLKLLRAPLLTDEKCQVLASLGVDTSAPALARQLARRQMDQALFRYGVKVDSEVWSRLVANAMGMSSVVLALEKMRSALAPE